MEQLLSREARETEVYKRELSAWFKDQKKEHDQSRLLEEHTAGERFKVLHCQDSRSPHRYPRPPWRKLGTVAGTQEYRLRRRGAPLRRKTPRTP